MTPEQLNHIRKFFQISTAVFDFQNKLASIFGSQQTPNQMHLLHKMALSELEKDEPNANLIDSLLRQMEDLAEENSEKK